MAWVCLWCVQPSMHSITCCVFCSMSHESPGTPSSFHPHCVGVWIQQWTAHWVVSRIRSLVVIQAVSTLLLPDQKTINWPIFLLLCLNKSHVFFKPPQTHINTNTLLLTVSIKSEQENTIDQVRILPEKMSIVAISYRTNYAICDVNLSGFWMLCN